MYGVVNGYIGGVWFCVCNTPSVELDFCAYIFQVVARPVEDKILVRYYYTEKAGRGVGQLGMN